MSDEERTYKRDLTFSQWHRRLGSRCPAINIDWLEYCPCHNLLAVIEDAYDTGAEKNSYKTAALANQAHIPAWTVLYKASEPQAISCPTCGQKTDRRAVGTLTEARVQQIAPKKTGWKRLSKTELADWYKRTVHACLSCGQDGMSENPTASEPDKELQEGLFE